MFELPFRHLIDLHCHLQDSAELASWRAFLVSLPAAYEYKFLMTAVNYDQASWLFPAIQKDPLLAKHLIPMAGLHPWQAGLGRAEVDRLRPYLEQSPFVGEIGLDRPWCQVPLDRQVDVLKYQLSLAQAWGKPILLHSKGYERELLALIQDYPHPIIVHWYSCEDPDLLQAYIDLGCHFTLSSDQGRDPGTRLVWQQAPAHRIHLESDGYEAVVWAQDLFGSASSRLSLDVANLRPAFLTQTLSDSVNSYARLHGLSIQQAEALFYRNSQNLLTGRI